MDGVVSIFRDKVSATCLDRWGFLFDFGRDWRELLHVVQASVLHLTTFLASRGASAGCKRQCVGEVVVSGHHEWLQTVRGWFSSCSSGIVGACP